MKTGTGKEKKSYPGEGLCLASKGTGGYRDKGSYLWGSERTGFVTPWVSLFLAAARSYH